MFLCHFILDASRRDRSPFMLSSIIHTFALSGDVYLKVILSHHFSFELLGAHGYW